MKERSTWWWEGVQQRRAFWPLQAVSACPCPWSRSMGLTAARQGIVTELMLMGYRECGMDCKGLNP